MLTIRPAVPADEAMLTTLLAAAYGELDPSAYPPGELAPALPAMSRANPKLLGCGTFYVVEVDGEPAGCGGWTFEAPGTGELTDGVAHIRHFATDPAHLRKGVARTLLDRCLAEASARGATTMKSQATLPAEKFYVSAGFRRVRLSKTKMGPDTMLSIVEMERPLP